MKIKDHALWQRHVQTFSGSGLSRAAYCRKHGLSYSQMVHWQRRLQSAAKIRKTQAFARAVATPESLPQSNFTPSARLMLGAAGTLDLPSSFDPAWVARLILELGGGSR